MLQKGLETMIGLAKITFIKHVEWASRQTSTAASILNLEFTMSSVIVKLWWEKQKHDTKKNGIFP